MTLILALSSLFLSDLDVDAHGVMFEARYAQLKNAYVRGEPQENTTVTEVSLRSGEHAEFRISRYFWSLNSMDQRSILNHELMHIRDLANRTLQNSLRGLPPELREAVLEIRAIVFAQTQKEWITATPKTRNADLDLLYKSWEVVDRWVRHTPDTLAGQPLETLTARLDVRDLASWVRTQRMQQLRSLLALDLEVIPLAALAVGEQSDRWLAAQQP
ncbi:MAG: hypothetical protein KDC35_08520 [Acidobacteria bacterium]|nr:hypothetical protein [Acidobacteriota bacterium]